MSNCVKECLDGAEKCLNKVTSKNVDKEALVDSIKAKRVCTNSKIVTK
jgi:hypothetical protein